MEDSTYVDPLADLFPRADKSRFAHINWPKWNEAIFNPDNLAIDNAHELAFLAGLKYAMSTMSLDRPPALIHILDTNTLNFIGRFGLTGFPLTYGEVAEITEGNQELAASYYAGAIYTIETLRDAKVPEDVNEQDLKDFLVAFEAFVDKHYIEMSELGAQLAQEAEEADYPKKITIIRMMDTVPEEDEAGEDPEDHEGGTVEELSAGGEGEGEPEGEGQEQEAEKAGATESKPATWAKSKKAKKAKMLAKRKKAAAEEEEAAAEEEGDEV